MAHALPVSNAAFFIPGARQLDEALVTGRIYPFLDNVRDILKPLYPSPIDECLFHANFVDRVYSFDLSLWRASFWNPCNLTTVDDTTRIYATLGWTSHRIEKLIANAEGDMRYYLTIYLDTHIPLMNYFEQSGKATDEHVLTDYGEGAPVDIHKPSTSKVYHQGNLPDVLRHIADCSFFGDMRSSNPIIHVLSKSLPHRCKVRNILQIVSSYSRKHDSVYEFVFGCLRCSLLGLYETCRVRPTLAVRMHLIRIFDSVTKPQILQWMTRNHQQLLFYVIKEFLIFGVREIPSVYAEVRQRYQWAQFEQSVACAMDTVRGKLVVDPELFDFKGIETLLTAINKQQAHHLYRTTRHMFCSIVVLECEKLDDANCVIDPCTEITPKIRELMHQLSIRAPTSVETPYDWLQYFNVSRETIRKLTLAQETYVHEGSKTTLKGLLAGLSRHEFEHVRELSEAFDRKLKVRIFKLPAHVYKRQCMALRRKHHVPGDQPLESYMGQTYLCLQCKQFKGFVNRIDDKGKPRNLYAYGNAKILFDDETSKRYCGRRSEKIDKKRQHYHPEYSAFMKADEEAAIAHSNERSRKRNAKERRKDKKNQACTDTELTTVNLLGSVLEFYGQLYTVCPSCGNFMNMNSKYFTKDGFYCGCCIHHGRLYTTISCEWCKAMRGNEQWDPIHVLDEDDSVEETKCIYLCQACYKPWIRNADTRLKLSTIRRGLTERWKKLQHAGF